MGQLPLNRTLNMYMFMRKNTYLLDTYFLKDYSMHIAYMTNSQHAAPKFNTYTAVQFQEG